MGEFSGPVRLRERHFFVQFVENDEKYFGSMSIVGVETKHK